MSFPPTLPVSKAFALGIREPVPGQRLGRFELLLLLARGGMAQVWAARLRGPRGFRKLVAIKVIWRGALDDARFEEMLLQEANLACQIHHPNVVETLELGEDEGMLHLAMEWIDGETLSAVAAGARDRGGVPLNIALNIVGQACRGLQAAHDLKDENGKLLGLVHRDVSPQNILISYAGVAKIVDFGIAKATSQASSLTAENEVKGKFAYIAPEQARGQAVDRRTDLFSLGIILYLLTTGRHPFKGATPAQTVAAVCSAAPPAPPSSVVEDYPEDLEAIVLKAISKTPTERFASATEMLRALERAHPAAFESGFEVQVAQYMAQLFENRSADRRAAIRLAEDLAEKTSTTGTGMTPMGSTLQGVSKAHEANAAHPRTATGIAALVGGKRSVLLAAGALVSVALLGTLLLTRSGSKVTEMPMVANVSAPTPPVARPAPLVAAAPAVVSVSDLPSMPSAKASSAPRVSASARVKVVAPGPNAPVLGSTVAANGAAPSIPTAKPNAWDPNVFGGRN